MTAYDGYGMPITMPTAVVPTTNSGYTINNSNVTSYGYIIGSNNTTTSHGYNIRNSYYTGQTSNFSYSDYENKLIRHLGRPDLSEYQLIDIFNTLTLHNDYSQTYYSKLTNGSCGSYNYGYHNTYVGSNYTNVQQNGFTNQCLHLLVTHPNARDLIIEKILATDPGESIVVAVVTNPRISPTIITKLAKHPSENIRVRVIENTYDMQIIDSFFYDPSPLVRASVAKNFRSSKEKFELIINDHSSLVKVSALQNPIIDINHLKTLSKDVDNFVRMQVANHHLINKDILKEMYIDESNESVKKIILEKLTNLKNLNNFK